MREQLKAAREKAAELLAKADAIRCEYVGKDWPAEKEAEFDAIMGDFGAANTEVEKLTARVEKENNLDQRRRDYNSPNPADDTPHRGTGPTQEQAARDKAKHREAFGRYLRYGAEALTRDEVMTYWKVPQPQETHAHGSVIGDLGGFLVPVDFRAEVLRDLPNFAVIRPMARTYPTGRNMIQLPTIRSATGGNANIYSSDYVGAWRSENYVTGGTAPTVQNQPTFGLESVPVHIWQPNAVELPVSLLEDSAADIDQILSEVIAETWGLDEDAAFINGSGVGQPLGLRNSGLTEVNSGDANLVKYNGLVDLLTGLPAQYRKNAKFLMNSGTYGAVMKLADSAGLPLFPVGAPIDKLWLKEIVISEFMPAVAANAHPIIFGDFRYYGIADRQELRIQRLMERFAPNVGVLPMARVGGQVLRPNAFRRQKIAA